MGEDLAVPVPSASVRAGGRRRLSQWAALHRGAGMPCQRLPLGMIPSPFISSDSGPSYSAPAPCDVS